MECLEVLFSYLAASPPAWLLPDQSATALPRPISYSAPSTQYSGAIGKEGIDGHLTSMSFPIHNWPIRS